jgi:flagellar hook-associated protein 1 FlgK
MGLFTYSGGPAVPATGITIAGLAAGIRINSAVDPLQGGDAFLLRDGGVNGAAYVYNSTAASGFSDRLRDLVDGIAGARAFDPASGLSASASILDFSLASAGWLEGLRQTSAKSADFEQAVQIRTADALQRKTGVNIDEEMTVMLDLERSYQASSKIIATVDAMLAALLEAAG